MSIDEAITYEKEKTRHAKEEYLMLQDDNWTDVETYEKRLNNCASFVEYHEQIAEWLEELKELRDYHKRVEWVVKTQNQIRNDAIDEFAEDILNKIIFEEKWLFACKSNNADTNIMIGSLKSFIKSRAGQLKEKKNGYKT